MGALLGVAQGSTRPSRLVVMQWNGGKPKDKPIAFVGKGVTFDTGGISLKPGGGMEDMKGDMGGAAAVIATMETVARLGLPIHLIGIVPSTDNMPGQNAIVPGDVISTYSGKTIEVQNTDAEGRLILADGLSYMSERYEPEIMIDLATLTGACVVALGNKAAGLFTANEALKEQLYHAGNSTCLLYTSPSPRDGATSRMPSSA